MRKPEWPKLILLLSTMRFTTLKKLKAYAVDARPAMEANDD